MSAPSDPGPLDPCPLELSVQQVKELQDQQADFLLLDCRELDEYQLVNISGAQLLPMSEIARRADELDSHRGRRIVVHCHHGGRSLRIVQWLRQKGFEQAQNMTGGIDAWSLEIDAALPRY